MGIVILRHTFICFPHIITNLFIFHLPSIRNLFRSKIEMENMGRFFVVALLGAFATVAAAEPHSSFRGPSFPGISQLSPFVPDLGLVMGSDLQDFSNTELPRLKDILNGWIPTGGLLDGLATALATNQGSILGVRQAPDEEVRSACDKLTEESTQCFLKELARQVGETWGTAQNDAEKVDVIAERMDTFGLLPASAELVCRHSTQILPLISYRQSISTEADVREVVEKAVEKCV